MAKSKRAYFGKRFTQPMGFGTGRLSAQILCEQTRFVL